MFDFILIFKICYHPLPSVIDSRGIFCLRLSYYLRLIVTICNILHDLIFPYLL